MESKLTNDQVLTALQAQFSDKIGHLDAHTDYLTVFVDAKSTHDIISWLKEHNEFKFQFLTNITVIHYPKNEEGKEIVVVYHLHSWENNYRFRLKTYLPIDNPTIESVTDLFASANWMERESYDFFGVVFQNHPDLRRILNEDSMDYFPMRKEYHLEDETRQDKDNRFFGR